MPLHWPAETTRSDENMVVWHQAGSNIVLDFHGDPVRAQLGVFSDGNHHMALEEALREFYAVNPGVQDIFYATTPPSPILKMLRSGGIRLGNLTLSVRPHVFLSPPQYNLGDVHWIIGLQ